MIFEPITEESIYKALEIVNSNTNYNVMENGNPSRTIDEISTEFLNPMTDSFFIIHENKHIGLIDFLKNNPKDNYPWLGLLMIHGDFHSLGYGKKAYVSFEEKLIQNKFKHVRIGVLQENSQAKEFWKLMGFTFYGHSEWSGKVVDCFEKQLN